MNNHKRNANSRESPRILVVEDDGIIAHHIQHVLTRWGYDVIGMVPSGEKALPKVTESLPDLVMMDIYLAGEMNGIETARQIQAQHDIPIVYLTAHPEDNILQEAKATGPYGYLTKPVQDRELRATIETALYKHQMERALRESERRYRLVSELVSDFAYAFRVEPEGTLTVEWITEAFSRIFGLDVKTVQTADDWLNLVHPNDRPRAREGLKNVLSGQPGESEMRIVTRQGETRWLHLYNRPVWDEAQERVVRIVGAAQDVTRRKEVEERAAHLTTVLRAIRNVNQLITHEKSRSRLLQQVCDLLIESRGYHHAWIALHNEDGAWTQMTESGPIDDQRSSILTERLAAGDPAPCLERALEQTGIVVIEDPSTACAGCPHEVNYGDQAVMAIHLAYQDRIYGVLAVSIPGKFVTDDEEQDLFREVAGDVSFALHDIEIEEQRQRAEQTLHESEAWHRLLLRSITDGCWALDETWRYTLVNEAGARLVGMAPGQLLGRKLTDLFPGIEETEFFAAYERAMHKRIATNVIATFVNPAGVDGQQPEERTYEVRVYPAPGGILCIGRDITERKQAEEQLRFQAMLLDQIRDSIVATDLEGRITYTNQTNAQMLRRPKEEIIGQTVHTFGEDPERGATQQEIIDQTLEQGAWRGQVVNYDRDGAERIIETRTWLIYNDSDAPSGMVGISTDITEQVYAEKALRESEERYRRLVELSPNLIAIHYEGILRYVNKAGAKLLGFPSPEQVIGEPVTSFVSPARRNITEERIRKLLKVCRPSPIYEQTIIRPDGTEREVEIVGIPFAYQDGTAVQIIAQDITKRKQAQKALEAAHQQLAATLNALPDILFEIDREGRILDFRTPDPKALYAPPEVFIGQTVYDFLPDDAVEVITGAIAEAVETGYHFGATYPLEMEGETKWFDLSIASKNGDRLIVLARDITERKRAEEQIKASLQEKEILIQEIHHRVKNNLQIISAMLEFQANASEDERLSQALQRVQNRVFALAHVYEHLHRSPNLAWINMANYLRCLVEHIHQACLVQNVTIQVDVDDVTLGIEAANPCGLIINELVSNALQHAFPPEKTSMGEEPTIYVTLRHDGATDQLVLTVGDNGAGLPEKDWQQPSALGLRIVKLLAHQLAGKIEMEAGAGTTFNVRFPAPALESLA